MEDHEVREWVKRELERGESKEVVKQSLELLGIDSKIVDDVHHELSSKHTPSSSTKALSSPPTPTKTKETKLQQALPTKEKEQVRKGESKEGDMHKEEGKKVNGAEEVKKEDKKEKEKVKREKKKEVERKGSKGKDKVGKGKEKEQVKEIRKGRGKKQRKEKNVGRGGKEKKVELSMVEEDVRFNVPAELVPKDLEERLKEGKEVKVNVSIEEKIKDIKKYSAMLLAFLLFTLALILSYLIIFVK